MYLIHPSNFVQQNFANPEFRKKKLHLHWHERKFTDPRLLRVWREWGERAC